MILDNNIIIGQIFYEDDDVIDEKVKAFYDYFHYYLSDNEYIVLKEQPIENHLSLLQKINFRVGTSKPLSSTKTVIINLIHNELFDTDKDIYFSKDNKNTQKIKQIRDLAKNPQEIFKKSKPLFDDIKDKYIENCLGELTKLLKCTCELIQHKEEIKYWTKLIAAEYLRCGFTRKELTGQLGIFQRILSKDVRFDNQKLFTLAVLPNEIEQLRGDDEKYRNTVEEYLKNRTFEQQFHGMLYYLRKIERCAKIIIRIKNFENNNKEILYNDTRIVSDDYLKENVNIVKWSNDDKEYFMNFISKERSTFIIYDIKYLSFDYALQIAIRKAENTLNFISYPNSLGVCIDKTDYICIENNKLWYPIWNKKFGVNFNRKHELSSIQISEKVIKQFLKLDELFFKSSTSSFWEDRISNAWRYLEILFKISGRDGNKQEDIACFLLVSEHNFKKTELETLIKNIVLGSENNRDTINWKIKKTEIVNLYKCNNSISVIAENTDYNFTNELIDLYNETGVNYSERYDKYYKLVQLLYEQRNFVIHQNDIDELMFETFISAVHFIVKRVRTTIIEHIKESNVYDIFEYVKILTNQGRDLKEKYVQHCS